MENLTGMILLIKNEAKILSKDSWALYAKRSYWRARPFAFGVKFDLVAAVGGPVGGSLERNLDFVGNEMFLPQRHEQRTIEIICN